MNKLILFLSFFFVSYFSFSQGVNNLIVFSEDGSPFTLFLNSVQQHEFPESNVFVGGLIAPNYKVKIVFEDPTKGIVERNFPFLDNNVEVTLRLVEKKGKYKLRFFNSTPIPQQFVAAPNQRVVNIITEPVYTETRTTTVIQNGTTDNVNVGVNIDGVGVGINVNVNQGNGGVVYQETTTTTSTTVQAGGGDHYIMQGYGGPIGCSWPMDPADFQSAKATIVSKTFDDTRLNLAKQIVSSNCLFADQVRDITSLLEFGDTKLEFAMFAYGYTYDVGNYFKVSQVFEFESSVDELNEYISSH